MQQIAVRRRDDADVDVDVADTADAADLLFLQGTQYFCLKRNVEFADLIQKKRAVVCDLKKALLFGDRTGKRAFFVAEQAPIRAGFH